MNKDLIQEISKNDSSGQIVVKDGTHYVPRSVAPSYLRILWKDFKEASLLGKNLAVFDIPFIQNTLEVDPLDFFDYKIIDIGGMFLDLTKDKGVPGLKVCMERSGIENPVVTHNGLQDAKDTLMCFAHAKQFKVEF